MSRTTIRLTENDELTLEKIKLSLNIKSTSEAIRYLINYYQNEKHTNDSSVDGMKTELLIKEIQSEILQSSKSLSLIEELLKQFYGEMSYKEYNKNARNNSRVKQFLNDYYNPEDKFMK